MDTENTPPDSAKSNGEHIDAAPAPAAPASGSQPSAAWVPPTVEELQKLLPQYQILQMLGRGGMGAVYKALQTSLDRLVAIKILSGSLQEKEETGFTLRFKNEARAMAKLNHPGIVSVYDFGETPSGLLYIVMEFVDGTDVSKMIASSGRLRSEYAMAITAHVCDALAYAHERGIIHRDIKPANIMVDYEGRVKVADFGLAKVTSSQAQSGLTHSNVIMGTLHYMAPESLILGTELDQRADIYAVGVMLYQMLTGKLPQGLFEMPSLRVPGLDPRYDKIVANALREDRELRYPSADALRRDLDAILTQPVVKVEAAATQAPAALNTQARPQRPAGPPAPRKGPAPAAQIPAPPKSTAGFWLGLVALVMVLGGGGLYWLRQNHTVVIHPAQGETKPGSPPRVVTRDMVLAAVAKLCPDAASKATVQQESDGRFRVDVSGLPVTDFTSLHGLNIWNLQANDVPISDLSSVVGVGMQKLWIMSCPNLTDLTPLAKCSTLRDLNLSGSPVSNLAPLQNLPLVSIAISQTKVTDITALRGMPLVSFYFDGSDADLDVSPLSECVTLEQINIPPSTKNIESLRRLPALQRLSQRLDLRPPMQTAAEFWAFYDRLKPWRAENADRAARNSADAATLLQGETESPDRACARWAVAIGAQVWIAGSSAALSSEADIPNTNFKIEKLVFYDDYKKLKERGVTASDMWRLEGLKGLRWLDLRGNFIGDSGAAKLASLTNLSTLNLTSCNVTDASMQVIGQLKQLTSLDLNSNKVTVNDKITDEGAAHLARLVNLEKLYLYRSNITDKTLTGVLAALPKLKYLEVHRTQVTEAGVQAFRKAKPDCNIKSDWPSTTPATATASPSSQPAVSNAPQSFTNTLGMKFVPVPGTKVMFCIHEARYKDYASYATESPGVDGMWKNQTLDGYALTERTEEHPVVRVSWEDAQKFCAWLSKKEGKTYRLPTDEEWSIAVGLGQKEQYGKNITPAMLSGKESTAFPWDGDFPPKTTDKVGNYSDASRKAKAPHDAARYLEDYDDGFPTTAPVMSFKPNKFGLYDLGGNVWEYCEDWYDNTQKERVLRGSSWFSHVRGGLLSSYRARHKPSFREDNYLGFRCVLEFPSETSNAPLKPAQNSTTVGPQLSEEMTLASARGGKLRAWGNFGAKDDQGGLRTIDISKADRYSDFVAVAGDGGILAALRKNKTLLAFEANDQAQTSFERDEVTGLFRDRVWPRYQVGGSLFHRGTLPTVTIKSPAPPLRALASFFHIRESGFVCIPEAGSPFWVPAPGTPAEKSSPPPSDLLQEATDAVGISSAIGVVSKAGRLRIWTPEKKVIETPSQYSDIVEIRGGGNFAVCRKRDGSVLVWPPAGHKEGWLPDPSVQRVPSLPPAVQVRCDLYVCAAQMTDGRWIGWGADAEVVAKISEIGKATDLAIAGLPADNRKPEKARYVVWIEPLPAETATLTANLPPELAALDTQFKALEKERVTSPYETALAKLNTGYLSSLQKAVTAEKAAGRQSGALALEAEQKRLAAAGSSASAVLGDEDDATAPLVLRNLRTIWRAEHARLLAVRATSLKALVDPLETRLAALEAEFAKANRQADSTKVRTHRDGLGKSLAEASSAAQAAALKAKTSADESPERACARWAVGLSGEVWKAGATSPLKSEADIPKTDFKIEKLVLNDGTAKKGAVSGMDMGRLDGLKGLRWLDVRGQPIGEVGVAKIETLDALETLDLHDCNLTDASLRVISRFRKLTRLDVGNNKDITDQGAAHLSSLTQLEWLNIYGSGVTDQTLTGVLASLPKLKYVQIHSTQVTSLGVQAFRKLKPDCLIDAGSTSSATAPKSAPSTPQAATLDPSKGYTNTLGMKFMPVPGLKVMFCIHETRRQDYAAFAKEATGVSDSWKNMKIEDIPCGDQDDHPVVGVSTEDAVKFCQWLSAKEGMTYRLPTDAEWSDAVGLRGLENPDYIPERKHAKVEDIYPWEGSYPPKTTDQAGNYADMLWHREFLRRPYISNYRDGYVTTAPVMSYRPNLYGLYDMGGNVWEWVEDLWTKEKGQTDGVLRGGAFDREAVLSSFRYRYRQQWVPSLYAVGFRVVMMVK